MQEFEYQRLVINPHSEDLDRHLGVLGTQGWELVAVVPAMGADGRPVWIFKRPR